VLGHIILPFRFITNIPSRNAPSLRLGKYGKGKKLVAVLIQIQRGLGTILRR